MRLWSVLHAYVLSVKTAAQEKSVKTAAQESKCKCVRIQNVGKRFLHVRVTAYVDVRLLMCVHEHIAAEVPTRPKQC